MLDWELKKISEIAEFNPQESIKKGQLAKKVAMEKLIPYCKQIPGYELCEFNGGTKFRNGDTIMARITPCLENGKISKVDILEDNEVGFGSTEYIIFRAITDISDPDFLYYLVTSPLVKEPAIKSMVGSSGRQRVQTDVVKNIEVNVPPFKIQQKIAGILSAIDNKISINNSTNNNLEQQAQAIYKSWFVDFEPFGGVMPDDWQCLTLGDVTENIRTRIGNNNYTVLSAVNTGKLQPSDEYFSKQVYSKNTEKYIIVEEGNFAYNPARINIGSIGINELGYTGCVSPVYVAFKVDKDYESFFRFYFKSSIFNEETKTRASGSVRQSLNYSDFALIEINYPSQEIATKFNDMYKTFFKVKKEIDEENQRLIQLRDTLLPKLMSGEIDVSNVDISTDKLSFNSTKFIYVIFKFLKIFRCFMISCKFIFCPIS